MKEQYENNRIKPGDKVKIANWEGGIYNSTKFFPEEHTVIKKKENTGSELVWILEDGKEYYDDQLKRLPNEIQNTKT